MVKPRLPLVLPVFSSARVPNRVKTSIQRDNENSEDCKTILVTKPDRLCRDIKTFSELQDNYSIISICNGANNLVNQLQIMLAQQYSENLSKSIKAGLQKRKVEEIKNEEVNMEEHSKNKTSQ